MEKQGPGLFAFTVGPPPLGGQLLTGNAYVIQAGANVEFKIPKYSKAVPRRIKMDVAMKHATQSYGNPSDWPSKNSKHVPDVDSDDEGADINDFFFKSP